MNTVEPDNAWHEEPSGPDGVRWHQQRGDVALREGCAYQVAAGHYELAVRLLREQPDLPLPAPERAGLYYQYGEVLETLGQIDEALVAYQTSQKEAGQDRARWAQCARSMAWLLCRRGELEPAATACQQALTALSAEADEQVRADVRRTAGMIEILRGRYESASILIEQALGYYQQGPPSEGLARCYSYQAQIYHDQGDLEAMLEATQRARAVSEALGDPVAIGQALNNVAYVLVLLGRDRDGLPLLFRAARIFEQHQVEKYLPSVYHSLAAALLKCGRGGEALPYLEQGLEKARRLGEVRTLIDFYRLLAQRATAAGQIDEARAEYEKALEACAGCGLEPQRAEILREYGDFLRQVGKPDEAFSV